MRMLKWGVLAAAGAASIAGAEPAPPSALPEWKDHMARLAAVQDQIAGEVYQSSDPRQRQDAWDLMFAQLARGYLAHSQSDPDYPEFMPLYNSGLNVAAPNPDFIYYGSNIEGTGTYRLRGLKGTNRFTFLQFSSRQNGDRDETGGTANISLGGFALDDIPADKDGKIDFILSPERPPGYTGEWRKLDPRSKSVFMRAASYDWLNERDPVVGIEGWTARHGANVRHPSRSRHVYRCCQVSFAMIP